ncbi:MAG TPA: hypothetical protein PKY81_03210 [bacterium]|nr:hypothetical protein [bacterium]HPN29945.1 hypothetical protein [bacterium]
MLKVIITIDCDFEGYFPFENKIKFNKKKFDQSLESTICLIEKTNVPAHFLIHTSVYMRRFHNDIFYTDKKYISLWKKLFDKGHCIGLHPHEEECDGKCYYYYYPKYMDKVIKSHSDFLNQSGIISKSIRFGYFTISEWTIPILEKYGILLSFDNMGGYIPETSNHFEEAPLNQYYYSYRNKEKSGSSKVLSVPLGITENKRLWKGLVPEANSFEEQKELINELSAKSQNSELLVNLLMHSYNVPKNSEKIFKTISYIKSVGGIIKNV